MSDKSTGYRLQVKQGFLGLTVLSLKPITYNITPDVVKGKTK
jgi:hypothetical protein